MREGQKAYIASMKVTSNKSDRAHIDLNDEAAMRAWAKKLGKSVKEIIAAVEKVGTNAKTVEKELKASGRKTP